MGQHKRSRVVSTSNILRWHQSKKSRIDGAQHENGKENTLLDNMLEVSCTRTALRDITSTIVNIRD
ncbi:hypothetical protein BJ138DRAFT_1074429 [Hygrophoropsis aurantiaca]|uniref:Uncharacterized protein n=1 Tax=Hygrophoropsis aurantiaca TaxID=72124 RepID=A0ACB7ZNQ6_9AGAM|nr:hypothetical protein BJ138DRAFT_1074429 [Hygrophoropsis aurantiaca]